MTERPVVALEKIAKSYGATRALEGVSLAISPGEVHGLAGINGAGKSTLMRILSGAIADHEGRVLVDGEVAHLRDPAAARRAGIAIVHQELSLVRSLTLEDALLAGIDAGPLFGFVDRRARRRRAQRMLDAISLEADLDALVETLPLAVRQLAQIGRALDEDAKVLVLDEPTSALGERETRALLDRIKALRQAGRAILFCTHRLEELFDVADRVTVLRDGKLVATRSIAELDRSALVDLMLGEAAAAAVEAPSRSPARENATNALAMRSVTVREGERREADGIDLDVARGEIVGMAALRGAGAEALLRAAAGLSRFDGDLRLFGEPYAPRSAQDAARRGVLMLAADRGASVFGTLRVLHNASLTALRRFTTLGLVRRADERKAAGEAVRTAGVKGALEDEAWSLSGGNQQKLAFARCLLARPRVLLLHEPTRGVDVGAQRELHDLIRSAAAQGTAVLVASSELDELVLLCDRVIALAGGRVARTFERGELDRAAIARTILRGSVEEVA